MAEQSRLVVLNDEQWAVLGPLIDECRPRVTTEPVAVREESNKNCGAVRAAAANGAGWTLLPGRAGYKGVNRSWGVPSRVRVGGYRNLSV
jgi:hypothetical protein